MKFSRRKKIVQTSNMLCRISLLLFLSMLFLQGVAFSKELVSCRYLKSEGQDIQLKIDVHTPPPASLILTQRLPSGITIEHASPAAKKYSRQRGEAKWLFKGVKPGTFIVALKLNKPIGAGVISGEIRYMDPVSGAMIHMPVRP